MNLINSGFLRGIGVGLIVAGLLINFSRQSSEQSKLSAQQQVVSQENTQQTKSQPKTDQPQPDSQPEPQLKSQPKFQPKSQDKTPTETVAKQASSPDVITLKIPSGSGSEKIAALLHDQGLITNEQDFATLSEKMKADTRFKAGKFSIPRGATGKEIIAILTGK